MKNVMFADVPVGGKFFYMGYDYLKTKNYQNGKLGAVNVNNGQYWSDCSHWVVTIPDTQLSEEVPSPSKVQVLVTYAYNEEPAFITMTAEQLKLFKILYNNDFLGDDVNYTIIDNDINSFDATKAID